MMKAKTVGKQEFAVAGVSAVTGLFFLIGTWPDFKEAAEDHPAIGVFLVGVILLFMANGMIASALSRRSWMKQMEKMRQTTEPSA